ncbi:DinB family protein [Roseivirga sp.]|uniref:DinB family protein n=1 Tax=Roseivirga sp. TaxID=1964215 RepID=UPI003B52A0AC
METPTTTQQELFISTEAMLEHWQGHRNLTRRVIEAFPEDKLFNHSIGGMRPFAHMAMELIDIALPGVKSLVSGQWENVSEFDHTKDMPSTKADLLKLWDKTTEVINEYGPQITSERYQRVEVAFGQYENHNYSTLLYFVDNEIHHRGQAYVYLRSLDIQPPFFWER